MPQKHDLTIYRGDPFSLTLSFRTSNDVPIDLAACTFKAQIRTSTELNAPLVAEFVINQAAAPVGDIKLELSGSATQKLAGGTYAYDFQIDQTTKLYGTVTLIEDVTHD